jgi:hypothetical protein
MIDVSKYKIPKFENLKKSYDFKLKTEIKFAAHVAIMYHEFAYHQVVNFCDTNCEFFEKNLSENNPAINTYLYKAWSQAYSVYTLLRTTIEATRRINKEFLQNNDIGDFYNRGIKKIADVANDIIKHPMFNGTNASCAYLPIGLGLGDEIDVQKWTDRTSPSSTIEIYPEEDFYTVCNYLEHIAELIMRK